MGGDFITIAGNNVSECLGEDWQNMPLLPRRDSRKSDVERRDDTISSSQIMPFDSSKREGCQRPPYE